MNIMNIPGLILPKTLKNKFYEDIYHGTLRKRRDRQKTEADNQLSHYPLEWFLGASGFSDVNWSNKINYSIGLLTVLPCDT